MSTDQREPETGVVFPVLGSGRSTSALGRAVVSDALRGVDPVGARAAQAETSWRSEYRVHFRRLVEAGLLSAGAAVTIARSGLAELHDRMRFSTVDGETSVAEAVARPPADPLTTVTVSGAGPAEQELVLPYRGQRLTGSALFRQLDAWVDAGIIEPSCAEAVRVVAANKDWLRLDGQ